MFLFFVLMAISAVILAQGRGNLLHRKIKKTSTYCLRILRVSHQQLQTWQRQLTSALLFKMYAM
jgi:hypothetical protein